MYIKPFHVFTVEGHAYLVKLIGNRVYSILQSEADVLRTVENKSEIDVQDTLKGILYKYGLVVLHEQESFDQKRLYRWEHFFNAERNIYALELMVSKECNMQCSYCYGSGNFGGSGLMEWNVAKHSVAWLLQAAGQRQHPPGSELVISFFGGEPLLNFPVIRKTVEYIRNDLRRNDIRFSITTNLYLLTDEMLDFFVLHDVGLCISFDGQKQKQNRRLRDGSDSYDRVSANIRKVLAQMPEVPCRGTLYGTGSTEEMQKDLIDHGFRHGHVSAASGNLLNGTILPNKGNQYCHLRETYTQLTHEYIYIIKTRNESAFRKLSFDSEFMRAIGTGWTPQMNMMSCGCGRALYTIDTNGDIYPCHRFVGVSEMVLGSIWKPYEDLDVSAFSSHITFENEKCKDCFLRFSCGGGCIYENYCDASVMNGKHSIYTPFDSFCDYQRNNAELAIHLSKCLNSEDKKWMRELGYESTK